MKRPASFCWPLLCLALVSACAPKPIEFSSAAGRFSLTSPVELTESSKELDSVAGKMTLHRFTGSGKTHTFVACYCDQVTSLETDERESLLDTYRNGEIKTFRGTLVSEKKITLDGHPGRAIVATGLSDQGHDMTINFRILLVGHRYYEFVAFAPAGELNQSAVDAFMQSIKISPPPPAPNPAQPTAFRSPTGRFQVMSPVPLTESVTPVATALGPVDMHLFIGGEAGPVYMIAYIDSTNPANASPEALLDGARDGAIANVKGTLSSERNIVLDSHPGREIVLTFTPRTELITSKLRMFMVGNRLYQIQVLRPGNSPVPDADAFLDSFKILPPAN